MNHVSCLWRGHLTTSNGEARWQSGLRRGSAAARLLGSGFRIPPGAWISSSCGCYMLSRRGPCVGADHSSKGVLPSGVCVCVWSRNLNDEEAMAHWGCRCMKKKWGRQEVLKSVRITLPHVPQDSKLHSHRFDKVKFCHILTLKIGSFRNLTRRHTNPGA